MLLFECSVRYTLSILICFILFLFGFSSLDDSGDGDGDDVNISKSMNKLLSFDFWFIIISIFLFFVNIVLVYNMSDTPAFRMDGSWSEYIQKYRWQLNESGFWERLTISQIASMTHC